MVYKFFDKKSKGTGLKNGIKENQQLANKLHNQLLGNLKKEKCILLFKSTLNNSKRKPNKNMGRSRQ